RSHVDKLKTVVKRGNDSNSEIRQGRFSFGILVCVLPNKISELAIDRARISE
ncbi:4565_t:CDS:1, partial [Racocetra persica]